ncbi:hypothetical protein OOK13_33580 [Streptomyces sp. NBC_00378]|uniref:hypothetical protein n=1 Tax=unclassified Streptomyces TaxID=2593676 RepID=UPI00225376BC|nr:MULTISPECIES: hypothetical protein [unclassified Streptomyces]MCX5113302.1 hypothetical protein [Streptomyces sp. NBC_00378]
MAGDDFGAFVAPGADVLDIDIAASGSLITAAVAAAALPLGVRARTLTRRVQRGCVQVFLAGEASAAAPTGTFEVRFGVPTAGGPGWSPLSLHLGADDAPTKPTAAGILHNGYTVQVSNTGSLRIYRDDATADTSTQPANAAAGTALRANTVYTLHCVVTATRITVSVPEAGVSTT